MLTKRKKHKKVGREGVRRIGRQTVIRLARRRE